MNDPMLSARMRESVEALRQNILKLTDRKPRILLVDDNSTDSEMLRQQLVRQCVPSEIVVVDTCEQAFELIQHEAFDLVFLDLKFPGMSGVELLRKVGSETERIPFIAISGDGSMGDNVMQEALTNGARAIFRKNFQDPELRMVCGVL